MCLPKECRVLNLHWVSNSQTIVIKHFQTAYCATKHAIKGLMEAIFMELRQEHPDHQIKTTTVSLSEVYG